MEQANELLSIINNSQNDNMFIKTSIKINFDENNKFTVFYLPYIVAKLMINKFPITEVIDIKLSFGESVEAFKLFLTDLLRGNRSLYVTSDILAAKYMTARRFNTNFYTDFKHDNLDSDIKKMVQFAKLYSCEDMIVDHCFFHTDNILYYIHKCVVQLPLQLFEKKFIELSIEKVYDADIVSLYSGIAISDSYGKFCKIKTVSDNPMLCNISCDNYKTSNFDVRGNDIVNTGTHIKFINTYSRLLGLQTNINFIKHDSTILVKIISGNCHKIIFVPSIVLKELDTDYYNVMMSNTFAQEVVNYQINNEIVHKKAYCVELTENESIDGYCKFMKDYIDSRTIVKISHNALPYCVNNIKQTNDYNYSQIVVKDLYDPVSNCIKDLSKYVVALRYNLTNLYKIDANKFLNTLKKIEEMNRIDSIMGSIAQYFEFVNMPLYSKK